MNEEVSPAKFPMEVLLILGVPFVFMAFQGGLKFALGWLVLFVATFVLGMWIKEYVNEERSSGLIQGALALISGGLLLVAAVLGLAAVAVILQFVGAILGIFSGGYGPPPENWRR